MRKLNHIVVVVMTLLACVGCDQATKTVAKEYLHRNEVVAFLGDTVRLQYAENRGAFLGMGASLPVKARALVFSLGISAIVIAILIYLFFGSAIPRPTTVALSLIAGGGLSNLTDRIAYGGYVIDFLNIGVGSLRTGIFNLADVAIVAGVIFLVAGKSKSEKNVDL